MLLTSRQQLAIGIVLAVLIALTRTYHFADLHHLPGASWAVFLLAGIYLRSYWAFPLLFAEAILFDFAVYSGSSFGDVCFTPAYFMLLPAYAALWAAGRWYASRHTYQLRTMINLSLAVLLGTLACELLSSGSYYLLSGLFSEPNLAEFIGREIKYYPSYLGSVVFYVSISAALHVFFVTLNQYKVSSYR